MSRLDEIRTRMARQSGRLQQLEAEGLDLRQHGVALERLLLAHEQSASSRIERLTTLLVDARDQLAAAGRTGLAMKIEVELRRFVDEAGRR